MSFSDATTAWAVIAAVLAAIVLIDNCAKAVERWKGKADAPTNELESRVAHVEQCLSADNRRIKVVEEAIEVQERESKLLLRAVVSLMQHEIDGNHTAQLSDCKNEIENYLISK